MTKKNRYPYKKNKNIKIIYIYLIALNRINQVANWNKPFQGYELDKEILKVSVFRDIMAPISSNFNLMVAQVALEIFIPFKQSRRIVFNNIYANTAKRSLN